MKILRFCLVLLFISAGLTHVNAQEMQAKKIENPHWVSVSFIKFQPGKKDKAEKIIEDYFSKADQNAGIEAPTVFNFTTGDYDYVVVWNLKEGVETLNYEMTPDDVKWFAELGKLAGGMDKANEKMNEFFSYVQSWKTELALKQ